MRDEPCVRAAHSEREPDSIAASASEFRFEWHGRNGGYTANRTAPDLAQRAGPDWRRASDGPRFWLRDSGGQIAEAFRVVLHDEKGRHGPGTLDLPRDYRDASGQDLGREQPRRRGNLRIRVAANSDE